MSRRKSGFTLIELIVVIVLLGLLAAVALPRFVDLSTEARAATLSGVRGGFTAATQLVHAKWLVGGTGVAGTVTLDGGTTVVVNDAGWPTVDAANGSQDTAEKLYALIMSAPLPDGFTSTQTPAPGAGTATFTLPGSGGGSFTYDATTGQVN